MKVAIASDHTGYQGDIVGAFLNTEFEGGRHAERVEKIARLEHNRD